MQQRREVPAWNPFVRAFHWTVVAAFVVAFLTGDEALALHLRAGYLILALLAARIAWGFIGPRHARFADFVNGPRQALANRKDTFAFRARRYLGHTPAGGAMKRPKAWKKRTSSSPGRPWRWQGCTGWAASGHRENLVRCMITGRKRAS
ncbi:MAG TPA: cytochrome b/b6 domain-containing protein [Gammaproteobacteria bacterium]|nr:cytochrome b/b6 domain-containing protein [Gammaproteobacteria bacterium]